MRLKQIAFGLIKLSFLLIPISGNALILTGAELLQDSEASFPTRSPTLVGSSIQFGLGEKDYEKLVVYSVGPLATDLRVTVGLTRLTSDWDPAFALSDGTSISGVLVADNGTGSGFSASFLEGPVEPDCFLPCNSRILSEVFNRAGFPALGESVELGLAFNLTPLATTVTLSYLNGSATFVAPRVLDPSKSLEFVMIGDERQREAYQLDYLSFSGLRMSIPGPPTALTMLGGLAVLVGFSARQLARDIVQAAAS
jgi:hypothetical protein